MILPPLFRGFVPLLRPWRFIAMATGMAICVFTLPAQAEPADWFAEPVPRIDFSAGTMQLFDSDKEFAWGIAYRPAWRFHHIVPTFELGTGHHEEFYAAAGMALELRLPWNVVLLPSFSVGYYNARKGLDLGLDMQFASQISLHYEFPHGHRLGLMFGHLSNGSFSDYNPGTETLMLTYSLPLNFIFK